MEIGDNTMENKIAHLLRLFVFLGIVSLACGISIDMGNQESAPVPIQPTQPPPPTPVPPTPTLPPPSPTPEPAQPTEISSSPTPEQQRFFTEEFEDGKDDWSYFLTNGDASDLDFYADNGMLVFDITGTYLYSYAVYETEVYDNVRIDVSVTNRGDNTNNVSLLCRYDEKKGWYEANIFNSGLYDILYGEWKSGRTEAAYAELYSGGSNAIRTGMATNEYTLICDGNEISLYINGTKVRTVGSEFGLSRGQIGIGASSFKRYPVSLDFDWVKISEP
jgi:hypothetical protein